MALRMGEKEVSRWTVAARHFKLLLGVIGSPLLVCIAASNLICAVSERAPTHFQAAQFAEQYRGQRWVRVEGQLMVEYADAKVNSHNTDFVYLDVPLMPLAWKPGQAVHLVGSFAMPRSEVDRWEREMARSPQCAVTGIVGPCGPMRYRDIFPDLRFEEPVVFINVGGSPDNPIFSYCFLIFAVILLIGSWWLFLKMVFLLKR